MLQARGQIECRGSLPAVELCSSAGQDVGLRAAFIVVGQAKRTRPCPLGLRTESYCDRASAAVPLDALASVVSDGKVAFVGSSDGRASDRHGVGSMIRNRYRHWRTGDADRLVAKVDG